jgi:2-methylisocitrate lyase-like PEP mutase family enzyme
MSVEKQRRLRELLGSREGIAIAPGCHDALGARVIEQAGFPVAYMSGLCVAASLGYPDVGIIGMAEMVERAAVIARSIGIPLLADADTGYGSASNIAETVRAFERAGVAGIHLEDQTNPKKCAALPGKSLVSVEEMTARIRVALEARRSREFVVIGRTDAYAVNGLDDAIARAQAYERAGADATMVMGLAQEADMKRLVSALQRPTVVLMAEKLRPLIPATKLREIGYPLVIYPLSLLNCSVFAQQELAARLAADGTTEALLDRVSAIEEINALLGLDDTVAVETRYAQWIAAAGR